MKRSKDAELQSFLTPEQRQRLDEQARVAARLATSLEIECPEPVYPLLDIADAITREPTIDSI